MANKGGFVKFYRKMTDWEWYDDLPTRVLFMHLLVTVNWKDGKWHGIEIKRGQRVTSLATLAKETGLSVKQIRTALKHLESTHEVTHQRAHNCTFITVENYSKYQDVPNCEGTPSGTPDGKAGAKQGQSRGKAGATIEEEKEEEEVKKGRIIIPPLTPQGEKGEEKSSKQKKAKEDLFGDVPEDIRSDYMDWVSMRNRINKPITTKKAVTRSLNALRALSNDPAEQRELIQVATFNCWQSFYRPRDGNADMRRVEDTHTGRLDWMRNVFDEGGHT